MAGLKTPITYYGGKLNLVDTLVPIMDYSKKQFVSLFTGGGAVEFAKPKHEVEVWNDIDNRVVTFWEVLQDDKLYPELERMIKNTLHSEAYHTKAEDILKHSANKHHIHHKKYSKVEKAWALWVQTNLSFGNMIFGGFAFANDNSRNGKTMNQRESFRKEYYDRVKNVQIFNRDAIDLLLLKDTPNTFFFADPPYVSSDQGHYDGYTENDFLNLLDKLSRIKGTFLLTSYPEEMLMHYREKFKWESMDKDMALAVTGKRDEQKRKTECITFNYRIQLDLFKDI